MNKQARKKVISYQSRKQDKMFSMLATTFSLLLIVLGIVTLIVIQKPIQEKQMIQKKAMVENGLVNLSYQVAGDKKVGQNTELTFMANTQNAQIDGVQLVFEVRGAIDNVTAQTLTSSGLNEEYLEVEKAGTDRWLVGVLAAKSTGSFSSNSATPFFKIAFTPTSAGDVQILLNRTSSKANITNSYPPDDQLNNMDNILLSMTDDSNNNTQKDDIYFNTSAFSINYFNSDGTQVAPETLKVGQAFKVKLQYALQNNIKDINSNDQTPVTVSYYFNDQGLASHNFSYNMLKKDANGYAAAFEIDVTGSTSDVVKHQLKVDVANTIDETNENNNLWENSVTIVGDNLGSNESDSKYCNQTCDSHTDCDVNLGCFEIDGTKRCRLATNVDNSLCETPADQGLNRSCNEYCADSNECSDDYFCYYNQCRRPDNPNSTSCAALDQQTSSLMTASCNNSCQDNKDCAVNLRCYLGQCRLASNPSSRSCSAYTKKYVSDASTKGGQTADSSTNNESADMMASKSADATGSTMIKASSTPSPKPSPVVTQPDLEEDALDAVTNNLKQRGSTFPIAMIGSGILIILLVIAFWLLRKNTGNNKIATKKAVYKPTNQDQKYIKNLQQQIQTLEVESPAAQPPTVAMTPDAGVPPTTAPTQPTAIPQVPTPTATAETPMMERLKEKGIKLPE